jgi:hypothetical protein
MSVSNVTVEELGIKPVNVKGQSKNTYSFKAAGQWYRTNFKNHDLAVGDIVSFSFAEDKYGKNVNPDDITRSGKAAPQAANAPQAGGTNRERSIIRQNALSHATALVLKRGVDGMDQDTAIADIITAARSFESYVTGELDEIEAMEAAEKKAA